MRAEEILAAKAWSLLHDPPYKAWHLAGKSRFYAGSHEEEARSLWRRIVAGTPLEGAVGREAEELARRADVLASSLDRWVAAKRTGGIVEYFNLVNIFDPGHTLYERPPSNISKEGVERFAGRVNNILRRAGDVREAYKLLYTTLELAWASENLPLGPADTRAPTHSIFDHLYATASMVNWVVGGDKPAGYLAIVDVPSIQRVVGSARKASDYWAGSYLVSLFAWRIVGALVDDKFGAGTGPETLLMPTARFNPFMLSQLLEGRAGEELRSLLDGAGLGRLLLDGGGHVKPLPLMPGTVSLALPPSIRNLEERLEELARQAWESIVDDTIGKLEKKLEEKRMDPVALALALLRKHRESLVRHSLPVRVFVVDVGRVYECLSIGFSAPDCQEIFFDEDVGKLRRALEILGEAGVDPRLLLFYAASGPAMRKTMFESKTRSLPTPFAWQIDRTEELYEKGDPRFEAEGGWGYCSVCGDEIALEKFARERPPEKKPAEYYDENTRNTIRRLLQKEDGVDWKALAKVFKPGESLGPLCLLKRAFGQAYAGQLKLASNEAVALSIARQVMKKHLEPAAESMEDCDIISMLAEEDVDYELIGGALGERSLAAVRERFRRCLGELRRKRKESVERAVREYTRLMFGRERYNELLEERLLDIRSYYAIVSGDGDSVGNLIQGRLGVDAWKYIKRISDSAGGPRLRESLELAARVAEALDLSLLPSPSYLSTLSRSLMLTAVKDAMIVEEEGGMLVYAGGDDVLALLPTETALKAVSKLRSNYWGDKNGFHRIGGLAAPAPVAYGRSFSLRIQHVMWPMKHGIEETHRILEERSKKVGWNLEDGERKKDSLTISSSRSYTTATLPMMGDRDDTMRAGEMLVDRLADLWKLMLEGDLSSSIPEDYERVREAVEKTLDPKTTKRLLASLLKRNLAEPARDEAENIVESNRLLHPPVSGQIAGESLTLTTETMKALRLLRGVPR